MLDTSQLEALKVADNVVRVFVSYSHQDAQYMEKESLLGFLSGLESSGIELWTDKRLVAGEAWDEKIRTHIQESDIALVLVSQAFLDSSYCTDVEISSFLDKRRQDGMVIFPVILSPCEWQRHHWLKTFQMLPGDGLTLEEDFVDPGKRKRLFLRIRNELRDQAYRIKARQATLGAPAGAKSKRRSRLGCLLVAAIVVLLAAAVLLPVEDWLPIEEVGAEGTLQSLRGWVRDGVDKGLGWLAGDSAEPSAPAPQPGAPQAEDSEALPEAVSEQDGDEGPATETETDAAEDDDPEGDE